MLGRAARAEGRAVGRLELAPEHEPADALARLLAAAEPDHVEAALGVEVRDTRRAGASPLSGISPMPRQRAVDDSNTSRISACAGRVARAAAPTRAYWFSTSARPSSSCRTQQMDALEDVERLEAGDHDRHAVALRRAARTRRCP